MHYRAAWRGALKYLVVQGYIAGLRVTLFEKKKYPGSTLTE